MGRIWTEQGGYHQRTRNGGEKKKGRIWGGVWGGLSVVFFTLKENRTRGGNTNPMARDTARRVVENEMTRQKIKKRYRAYRNGRACKI